MAAGTSLSGNVLSMLTRSYRKKLYGISDEDRRLLWNLAMPQVPAICGRSSGTAIPRP